VQEMKILLHQVSGVMSSSFGIDTKKINLLYESVESSEELNDNEKALVELMIEVLEDKGEFYEVDKSISEKNDKLKQEQTEQLPLSLADVVTIKVGQTFSKSKYKNNKFGIPIVRVDNLHQDMLSFHDNINNYVQQLE